MSSSARLILTQVLVVGVLVGVVYTIFLSPDDGGPLTGIETPKGQKAPDGGNGDQGKEPPAAPPVVSPPPTAPQATAPQEVVPPPAPTVVEYADTATQLRILLRTGRP